MILLLFLLLDYKHVGKMRKIESICVETLDYQFYLIRYKVDLTMIINKWIWNQNWKDWSLLIVT